MIPHLKMEEIFLNKKKEIYGLTVKDKRNLFRLKKKKIKQLK